MVKFMVKGQQLQTHIIGNSIGKSQLGLTGTSFSTQLVHEIARLVTGALSIMLLEVFQSQSTIIAYGAFKEVNIMCKNMSSSLVD